MLDVAYIEKDQLQSIDSKAFAHFTKPPTLEYERGTGTLVSLSLNSQFVAYTNIWSCSTSDNINWLEVAPNFRSQEHDGVKYSELALREAFKFCAQRSKNLGLTPYTEKGKRSLQNIVEQLKIHYPQVTTFDIPPGC